jgi:hypothetical protein
MITMVDLNQFEDEDPQPGRGTRGPAPRGPTRHEPEPDYHAPGKKNYTAPLAVAGGVALLATAAGLLICSGKGKKVSYVTAAEPVPYDMTLEPDKSSMLFFGNGDNASGEYMGKGQVNLVRSNGKPFPVMVKFNTPQEMSDFRMGLEKADRVLIRKRTSLGNIMGGGGAMESAFPEYGDAADTVGNVITRLINKLYVNDYSDVFFFDMRSYEREKGIPEEKGLIGPNGSRIGKNRTTAFDAANGGSMSRAEKAADDLAKAQWKERQARLERDARSRIQELQRSR